MLKNQLFGVEVEMTGTTRKKAADLSAKRRGKEYRMKARLKLTDKQFDALDIETRRSMIYQLMFIDTPKYQYCIGANGEWWTMVRYEWQHSGKVNKETSMVIDKWL